MIPKNTNARRRLSAQFSKKAAQLSDAALLKIAHHLWIWNQNTPYSVKIRQDESSMRAADAIYEIICDQQGRSFKQSVYERLEKISGVPAIKIERLMENYLKIFNKS